MSNALSMHEYIGFQLLPALMCIELEPLATFLVSLVLRTSKVDDSDFFSNTNGVLGQPRDVDDLEYSPCIRE